MARIKKFTAFLLVMILILAMAVPVFAASASKQGGSSAGAQPTQTGVGTPLYTNPETGYSVYIEDDADLLTDTDERALLDYMWESTAYGNMVFKSITSNPKSTTESFANDYYYTNFGNNNGTIFIIDMDLRKLWIVSAGDVYNIVTKGRAQTITDNTYQYASNGDYLGCAEEVFWEVHTILEGNRIAQPMKHVSNLLLAIMVALIINFIIILRAARLRSKTTRQLIQAAEAAFTATPVDVQFLNETKRYSPVETKSSGGGGGGFSGGGGGGGGFSGGGGGHSF